LLKPALTALTLLALLADIAAFKPRETPAQETLRHQRHEFTPAVFHNKFAAATTPAPRSPVALSAGVAQRRNEILLMMSCLVSAHSFGGEASSRSLVSGF
jgi:hypothetical protein